MPGQVAVTSQGAAPADMGWWLGLPTARLYATEYSLRLGVCVGLGWKCPHLHTRLVLLRLLTVSTELTAILYAARL